MSRAPRDNMAQPSASGLADEVAALASLGFDELRARFRRLYRTAAPAGLSRDLIARLVAHRLQEQQLGKLDDENWRDTWRSWRGARKPDDARPAQSWSVSTTASTMRL